MRDITIIAPHPDDEFLGCRQLLKDYGERIHSVLFVTNGELQTTIIDEPLVQYVLTRRTESENYLNKISTDKRRGNIFSLCLNVPDSLNYDFLNEGFYADSFHRHHRLTPHMYLYKDIAKYSNKILAFPADQKHPTHKLVFDVCKKLVDLQEKEFILYNVPALKRGLEFFKGQVYSEEFGTLKEELQTPSDKMKEFAEFYPSQLKRLAKSWPDMKMTERYLYNCNLPNWE